MDGWITIGTKLDTKDFDKQLANLEKKGESKFVKYDTKSIEDFVNNYGKVEEKAEETAEATEQVAENTQKAESNSKGLSQGFNIVNNSLEKTVKKVSRLVLGIFGIRSAFMFMRRASSDLATYDEQYATDLEYIRYVLTQAIAPVLRYIVNLAMTLLSYINAIVQAWFGVNLFANGSAESFKKMKKQAGGVSKAVKEIKKQLTGFDEINMLTADSDTGTGVGGGGVGTPIPSMDLSKLDRPIPKWIDWIGKHGDEILAFFAGLVTGLQLLKHGVEKVKALGIGLMVGGIVEAIIGLIKYLKDPSWKNFGKTIQGIGIFLAGLGITITNLPVLIAGVAVAILGTVLKYRDELLNQMQEGIDRLISKADWFKEHFGLIGEIVHSTLVELLQSLKRWFETFFDGLKTMFDGFIQFFRGVFTANWSEAWEGLQRIAGGAFTIVVNTVINAFNTMYTVGSRIVEKTKDLFRGVVTTVSGWFNKLGISVPQNIAEKFKSIINAILNKVEELLNNGINSINGLIDAIRNIPGFGGLGRINNIQFGRLAVGGIVNMPNKGRLIGGQAIAGESGAEGVIPLTDTQAMEALGAAMGKHIVLNLTNITKLGNRQIAREIKRVNAETDFAFNT